MCPCVSQYMCQCLFQYRSLCACHSTWNCACPITCVSACPSTEAGACFKHMSVPGTSKKRVRACLNTCNSACHSTRASACPSKVSVPVLVHVSAPVPTQFMSQCFPLHVSLLVSVSVPDFVPLTDLLHLTVDTSDHSTYDIVCTSTWASACPSLSVPVPVHVAVLFPRHECISDCSCTRVNARPRTCKCQCMSQYM